MRVTIRWPEILIPAFFILMIIAAFWDDGRDDPLPDDFARDEQRQAELDAALADRP